MTLSGFRPSSAAEMSSVSSDLSSAALVTLSRLCYCLPDGAGRSFKRPASQRLCGPFWGGAPVDEVDCHDRIEPGSPRVVSGPGCVERPVLTVVHPRSPPVVARGRSTGWPCWVVACE